MRLAGGDHDDRQVGGGGIGPQPPAHLVAVHPRHEDVEQDEVGPLLPPCGQRLLARCRRHDGVALGVEHGLQQPDVGRRVVDHQDPGRLVRAVNHRRAAATAVPPDLVRELPHVDRLGDVAVEAGLGQPLPVGLHHRGGEGHDENPLRRRFRPEQLEGADAVHVGQLDVHEDEVGLLRAGQGDALGRRRASSVR